MGNTQTQAYPRHDISILGEGIMHGSLEWEGVDRAKLVPIDRGIAVVQVLGKIVHPLRKNLPADQKTNRKLGFDTPSVFDADAAPGHLADEVLGHLTKGNRHVVVDAKVVHPKIRDSVAVRLCICGNAKRDDGDKNEYLFHRLAL